MINIYKLTNLLEAGMTIFQLNQWKEEGIWYPVTQYKKASTENRGSHQRIYSSIRGKSKIPYSTIS